MIAILAEHNQGTPCTNLPHLIFLFSGKWPVWLNPRQCIVLPVSQAVNDYADEVYLELHKARLYVDKDTSDTTLQKKIRSAQLKHYNFILVVGPKEQTEHTVSVRYRDTSQKETLSISAFINKVDMQVKNYK